MELVYESTAEFENAVDGLDKQERAKLVELINKQGQRFKHYRRSFTTHLTQPAQFRLKHGGENAFCPMPYGGDWSVLLSACREPHVWKEAMITLVRLDPRADAERVNEDVVRRYYRAEGLIDESAEANGEPNQAALRRERSHPRRGEGAANGRAQARRSRRTR
jgi:hypothetical protein